MLCIVFKVPPDIVGSQYEKLIIQNLDVMLNIIGNHHRHTSIPAHRIPHCRQQDQAKVRVADQGEQVLGEQQKLLATVYKGNIIKNLIMDCQSYTKYRPNETMGGIFVSWRRKEELPTGA